MIRKFFYNQINSITVAAFLIAFSSLVSRFLGIFRDRILAAEFGAGDVLDVYYAAFRIPDMIFNLLVLGALSAGFIPIFTSLIKNEDETDKNKDAWRFANNMLNALGLFLIILSLVIIIFTPQIMKLITPGFSEDKLQDTVEMTRIMFLSPFFMGISSVIGGVLQSFKRFFVYSLSPIFYNIGIIFGALYFVPRFGIEGLAWGVVLGAFLHMAVQLPLFDRLGWKYRLILDLKDISMRKIGQLMVPRTLTLAITQLNLLIITIVASGLESGSLSVFNLANNLQSFPAGIFGVSFALAAFPALSAAADKNDKMIEHFSSTFRQILFFIIPSTVLLLTLRAQIVRVVLGSGAFNWHDTVITIDTLAYFTAGLFAQATIPLLVRVFYARQNSKTPFYVGLLSVGMNVALSLWLPNVENCKDVLNTSGEFAMECGPLGVSGLALAFSISSIFNFIFLWVALRQSLGHLDEKRIINSVLKFSIASVACGLAVQGTKLLIWPYIDMTKVWGVVLQGAAAGLGGISVYLAFTSFLRSEEMMGFWLSFKRRLPWHKIEAGDQGEARGI